ncbi:DUF924 domain-containing protein [Shewanella maritima]|uniref:DUF924 domain-containing protein n=1 Tax=Shewanella maritima TaxID=2520507 RepID=A0A411PF79_9GAMM|nr:DUF924 family protein [Shewanella maritima]QBF82247.1 DUF924 domain-containing protein [Shewanella maritima]
MNNSMTAQHIIDFWFKQITPAQWWQKDDEFDKAIIRQFGSLLAQAEAGELAHWRESVIGRLAEVIVLDQFSRNAYRDTPKAFANDSMALTLAQYAVAQDDLMALSNEQAPFLIMPYMHSESALIHEQAVPLFEKYAKGNLDFELKHKVIIDEFGRYPHRNQILGRESSAAEISFLTQPGSSF